MIFPKLLTEKNGFLDNVVIEIQWSFEAGGHIEWVWWNRCAMFTKETWDNVESIHPLTGPMSIWNYAPEWANYCHFDDNINWFATDGFATPSPKISKRPWWAKKEN